MNGSKKIIFHYIFLVVCVSLLLLILNLGVIIGWAFSTTGGGHYNDRISVISAGLTLDEGRFSLSKESQETIDDHYAWAMLLDESGHVIWNYHTPKDLPKAYSASDISSFSKWYLQNYPVQCWSTPNGLFVLASPQNTMWKKLFFFPEQSLRNAPTWLLGGLILNLTLAVLLALLFSFRSIRSLKEIVKGIEDLSSKHPVQLKTKGLFRGLASNINLASNELIHRQELIEKRDTARNNWIAGVSHDIRTPLSMIMGYSSSLENSPSFSETDHKKLSIIRMQSERIKSLVDDLNLTTKLEYEMQPIHTSNFLLPQLLRKVAVHYLNQFTDSRFSLELNISEDCQHYEIVGDQHLFERALHNLISNSLGHNQSGCHIEINLYTKPDGAHLDVCDNGSGFENATLDKLNSSSELPVGATHGLGLFIVKQIIHVHHGQVTFGNLLPAPLPVHEYSDSAPLGCLISIVFPQDSQQK